MSLKIENLTKKYGSLTVLDNVSIEMNKGIYGIIGENGAGKSTLLNLIADNIKRTEGSIMYNGREILKMGKKYREKLGFMPQEGEMYSDYTAREFLRYMSALKGINKKLTEKETEKLLKTVNLQRAADRKLGEYSGGMKKRVMFAQAVIGNPEIIILDEPTEGLDPTERLHFRVMIKEMSKDRLIIYSTHVFSDLEDIYDYVILLKNGKIEYNAEKNNILCLEKIYFENNH